MSQQLQLLRAVRGFLGLEMQEGKVTRERAFHILTNDVGASAALAHTEVERLTFRTPGLGPRIYTGFFSTAFATGILTAIRCGVVPT